MKLPFGSRRQPTVVPRRRLSDQPPRDEARPTVDTTFRRNRTLTGSTSESVQSATEVSGQLQSPRATAHHLRRHRRHLGAMLLAGLAGMAVVGILLQQFTAEIRVAVVGQVRPMTQAQQERIVAPVESYLSSRPLERFRMLLNTDTLTAYLQSSGVRDVQSVHDVQSDGWGRSVVTVKVREPVARFGCRSRRSSCSDPARDR